MNELSWNNPRFLQAYEILFGTSNKKFLTYHELFFFLALIFHFTDLIFLFYPFSCSPPAIIRTGKWKWVNFNSLFFLLPFAFCRLSEETASALDSSVLSRLRWSPRDKFKWHRTAYHKFMANKFLQTLAFNLTSDDLQVLRLRDKKFLCFADGQIRSRLPFIIFNAHFPATRTQTKTALSSDVRKLRFAFKVFKHSFSLHHRNRSTSKSLIYLLLGKRSGIHDISNNFNQRGAEGMEPGEDRGEDENFFLLRKTQIKNFSHRPDRSSIWWNFLDILRRTADFYPSAHGGGEEFGAP